MLENLAQELENLASQELRRFLTPVQEALPGGRVRVGDRVLLGTVEVVAP